MARFRIPMRRSGGSQRAPMWGRSMGGGHRQSGSGQPRRGRRGFKILPLLLFGLFCAYYYYSNLKTVPLTGRSQIVDVTKQEETALGLRSYEMILSQSDVIEAGPEVDRIQRIGKQIAAVVGENDINWEIKLINSDQANAFALPGGKVAVYTGILPIADNDDRLAAIIGHEIAHVTARHGSERMTHQRLAQWGQLAVAMSVGEMDNTTRRTILGALGVGTQFGVLLPFSRKHESEADYIGLMYLARACFDPREAPKLWERMAKAKDGAGAPAELLSTHPAPETRIAQFEGWMEEALKVRAEHCG